MKITQKQLRRLIREGMGDIVGDIATAMEGKDFGFYEDDPEMADMSDLEVNINELSEGIIKLESARLGFRDQKSPDTDEISGAIDGSLSALRDALVQANRLL